MVWAEETGALCLRWMDPDSSVSVKTSVWTEWIPFVDLFLNFYLCSASLSLSELVSYNPSLPLLQSFFFHSCNKAAVNLTTFLSLFFNLQYSFALLCIFFFSPSPTEIVPWAQRYCRKAESQIAVMKKETAGWMHHLLS